MNLQNPKENEDIEEDVYCAESVEQLLEDDEIDPAEEAFMVGWAGSDFP